MAGAHTKAISSFIKGCPPGELSDVLGDIKAIVPDSATRLEQAKPAFREYNEDQLTCVQLSSGQDVIVSSYNSLGDDRYYSSEHNKSWRFDHLSQKASNPEPYSSLDSTDSALISALRESYSVHASEHFPQATFSVLPDRKQDNVITLLLTASKYSPSNFWNGRWRCTYHFSPVDEKLHGDIKVDVHYYEDGNVRMTNRRTVEQRTIAAGSDNKDATAQARLVIREIAREEQKYQQELNRSFEHLSESAFKSLRRQLPVTRQKMEWEKVGSYRAGKEIGGTR